MERYFNTEGICTPDRHYMVRLDQRVDQIKKQYVDRGSYFIINRGRQYGKTTTLHALAAFLRQEYTVVSLDFQMMSTAAFAEEKRFAAAFAGDFVNALEDERAEIDSAVIENLMEASTSESFNLKELFLQLEKICRVSEKPIVLLIDEVDSASNNQVFIDFLAQLRGYYLARDKHPTFHSVILAGVYDIKNLKLKIRSETEHKYNSPWNIAAKFKLDMDFSEMQIASMLQEYERDRNTGMEVQEVARLIYDYTSGYPYLVSAICKLLDEEIAGTDGFEGINVWTREGVNKAVQLLLKENPPLFDSMTKQLDTYTDLREMIENIIYRGQRIPFSQQVEAVNLGIMFGFLKEENSGVIIANRVFEMGLSGLLSPD